MITITLKGHVPSKKNNRTFSFKSRKPISLPSKRYRQYHNYAVKEIKSKNIPEVEPFYNVKIVFLMKGMTTKSDIDNMQTSIFDILQDSGVIKDDRYIVKSTLEKIIADDYLTLIYIYHVDKEKFKKRKVRIVDPQKNYTCPIL